MLVPAWRPGGPRRRRGAFTPPSPKAHLAFEVTDLGAVRKRLSEAGVRIEETIPIPDFARFSAYDPFGLRLKLMRRLLSSSLTPVS